LRLIYLYQYIKFYFSKLVKWEKYHIVELHIDLVLQIRRVKVKVKVGDVTRVIF